MARVAFAAAAGAGELLERTDSMSSLGELLAGVRSGAEGRLVLVGGEAGVGKTAVLRRFCDANASAARILWGACEPLRTPRPLGPLLDVAEATGGALEELVTSGARPHEVTVELLRELRRGEPTILVLEDVHWADEATLDVITLLAARIGAVAALVLASYRDDELDAGEHFRVVLGELARGPGRITLEPLSPAAVVTLAAPHGVDGRELHRRTGGNPFFVTEVLAGGGAAMPETVRDAVLARAARLSAPARRLLEAVAVVPGPVEPALLELVSGGPLEDLAECLSSGILSAGRTHVAFRHELARFAIDDAITPDRRLALHRAALSALAAAADDELDVARLAHHAEAAQDEAGVLRWAPDAARRAAASGAHREAAEQYARALRFAARSAPARQAELAHLRADECYMTDQFDAAIAAEERAIECYRGLGEARGEGDALRSLSRLQRYVGLTDEAHVTGLRAVELLEGLPAGHELALAYCTVSHLHMARQDAAGARAWGNRALELATRIDDRESLVYALTNIGAVDFLAGVPDGLEKLERALALALEGRLEEHAGRLFLNLIVWPLRHRMLDHTSRYLDRGFEFCVERGLDTWRLYLIACRARVELDRGNWEEAGEAASLVLADPRSAPVPRGWALAALGAMRARRGDALPAERLANAHDAALATGELQRLGPLAAARAEAAWLAGANALVAPATDAALELALECGDPWIAGELAYWRAQAGVRDELAGEALAEPFRLSLAGEWAAAERRWRAIGAPYEAALALAASDDQLTVRRALEELRAMGAAPAAAIVARRLRGRGVRGVPRGPHRRTRENPAGLTTRELEVLALLAEGMRNAQIAARLVVAEKTVDHHVSAILRKLAVSTRGEAGAAAGRLGLIGRERSGPSEPV